MIDASFRKQVQTWDRATLKRYQLDRLNELLSEVLPVNKFYQQRYGRSHIRLESLEQWSEFPTVSKTDWLGDAATGVAAHHSYSRDAYRRYHRTSGTRGSPMVIMDTQSDWQWWISTWQYVLDACDITDKDRIMMAFSFGPFIGFWSAHDACLARSCMVIPCGGMSTAARLDLIRSAEPTVIFSTPSYAMHLGEEAERRGYALRDSSLQQVFVAGEPGGSSPAVRSRIESMFGASVMDHCGATEVGPWGFGSSDGTALHVIESEFLVEFLPPLNDAAHQASQEDGGIFELVVTALGRRGAPVWRYRTGDLVRPNFSNTTESNFVRLEAGVIGRCDDMVVVRGVNIFPSSIDAIVRSFPEVDEYRFTLTREGALDQLVLEVEDRLHQSERLAEKFLIQLNLRVDVVDVPPGTLPRADGKARRIVDRR